MATERRRTRARMRASDADRERVVALLRDHFAVGRVTEDELSARVQDAYAARTLADLEVLTLDLPVEQPALPATRRPDSARKVTPGGAALRASFRAHFASYSLVNLMLIGIWAASGGGYFWPIWPILGWGIGVASHYAPIMAGVGTRRRRSSSRRRLAAPTSIHEVAETVDVERPSLRSAAAPDGTVTILFSDIVGSTALNQELGDVRWVELLRAHHAVVREQIRAHGGFEVKAQGDGFMIAFPGARAAVECARAIRSSLRKPLPGVADGAIQVRIGMHSGEAIREADDFYGQNVVLAARIAEQAQGGEILASEVVRQLAQSTGDIGFEDARELELQGLAGTHRVYRVV